MTSIYRSEEGERLIQQGYQRLLDLWPVPVDRRQLDTPEGVTQVLVVGPEDAPPVVLLHGSTSNASAWGEHIEVLADAYRVYVVDIVGEPGPSAPSRPPLASDRYALWLDAVFDGLGVQSAAVVALSLGGLLGVDLAIRRPKRVRRLVLLNPAGIGRMKLGILVRGIWWGLFKEKGRGRTLAWVVGPAVPTGSEFERELGDLMHVITENFRPRTKLPIFSDSQLERLAVPVLALVGEQDVVMDSAQTAERLSTLAPGTTVVPVADAGHLLTLRQPEVREFLSA